MHKTILLIIVLAAGFLLGANITMSVIAHNEEKKARAAIAKKIADQQLQQSSFSRQQDSLWSVIHYNDSLFRLKRTFVDSQQYYFFKALNYERQVNQAQRDYFQTGDDKYKQLFYKYDRLKVRYANIAYRWGEKALAISAVVK